jgi:hypothetical protein
VVTAHTGANVKTRIRILDPEGGDEVARCSGPAPDGSCPRVDIGAVIPCAGRVVDALPEFGDRPYTVSMQMTLCPVTVAASLASLYAYEPF